VADKELPEADGLFIGGGFPEYRMRELAANRSMRDSMREFIETGGVAYAECGGLMYLCRSLAWKGRVEPMCGVLSADVAMHERPQGRGYMRLRETEAFPWPQIAGSPAEVRAHEFHHSAILAPDPDWIYGFEVLRGAGIDGRHDAVIHKNLVAGYAHLRHVGGVAWTRRFVAHVRRAAA
jgi:cobyrinic acid a,c-diamide synthase